MTITNLLEVVVVLAILICSLPFLPETGLIVMLKAQGFPALNKADATAAACILTVTVCSSPKLIVVTSFEDCRMKVTRSGLT